MEHLHALMLLACLALFASAFALAMWSALAGGIAACSVVARGISTAVLRSRVNHRGGVKWVVGTASQGGPQAVLVAVAVVGLIVCCVGLVGVGARPAAAVHRATSTGVEGGSIPDPGVDEIRDYHGGLAAARSGLLWGFVDSNHCYVLAPQFHEVTDFHEGLAVVNRGWRYGVVNGSGEFVVEPRYMALRPFSEGLAPYCVNARWGYIDRKGDVVIPPTFMCAGGFNGGRARVALPNLAVLYIDREGNLLDSAT